MIKGLGLGFGLESSSLGFCLDLKFLTLTTSLFTAMICVHETFRMDSKRLWHPAIKFGKWQHPALPRGATFVMPDTTSSLILI